MKVAAAIILMVFALHLPNVYTSGGQQIGGREAHLLRASEPPLKPVFPQ
jgi:hypothetical protein